MRELLEAYPVVIEVPVAWGEMDSLRHVNNIVYFRYFESARMTYFERVGFWRHMDETGVGPILASTRCRFRLPLTYPDTVSVGARVPEIDGDRFLMKYVVVSHNHGKAAAEGEGMIVSYDYGKLAKATLPEVIRRRIDDLEGRSRNEL
ncbi:MAG TPA: thioesterase family protein [Pyrinomonadaceae bacterium]|nr:thioesterase family protein [Pyrinomonadaceae bacterium]